MASRDLFATQSRTLSPLQRWLGRRKISYRRRTKSTFVKAASFFIFVRDCVTAFFATGIGRLGTLFGDHTREALRIRARALRALTFTPDIIVAADPLTLDLDKFLADFTSAFETALTRGTTTRILVARDPAHEIELRFSPCNKTIEAICGRRKATISTPEFFCGFSHTIVHLRRENLRVTLTPRGASLASRGHLRARWY